LLNGGTLHGTTALGGSHSKGTVYQLTPPATPGGAWTETILHSFFGGLLDGYAPQAGVVLGPNGALYGPTADGGSGGGHGTIFEVTP
jgi:uncharacterized repeat protein (TIGR03803 family)